MIEYIKHRQESAMIARSFISGEYWKAFLRALWFGALKPAQDEMNTTYGLVMTGDISRYSMGVWNNTINYPVDSVVEIAATAADYDQEVIYNLGGPSLAKVGTSVYRTLIDGNVGNNPPDHPSKWEDITTIVYYRSRIENNLNYDPRNSPECWDQQFINTRKTATLYFMREQIANATNPRVVLSDVVANRFINTHEKIDQGDTMYFFPAWKYVPNKYKPVFFRTLQGDGTPYPDWGTGTYAKDDCVRVVTQDGLTIWQSLQDNNTGHAPESSQEWWRSLFYTGNRPKSGDEYRGLPGRRFLSNEARDRKWMLTFIVDDVYDQTHVVISVIKKFIPIGWSAEIFNTASSSTITVT